MTRNSFSWPRFPESLITGIKREPPSYPANAVLIAEDLTPSDTAAMERGKVMGFATVRGGATSHVAILARSLSIPALAGIEARALELPNGTPVILDGSKGTLRLNPSQEEIVNLREAQARQEAQRREDLAHALQPATTSDGRRIEVAANIGGQKDAGQVAGLGGAGEHGRICGVLSHDGRVRKTSGNRNDKQHGDSHDRDRSLWRHYCGSHCGRGF